MHYKLYAMMEVFFHLDRFFGGVLNIPAKINRHSGMAETARPEYRKPL